MTQFPGPRAVQQRQGGQDRQGRGSAPLQPPQAWLQSTIATYCSTQRRARPRALPGAIILASFPSSFLPTGFLLRKLRVSCSRLGKGRDSWPWGPARRALPPGRRRTGSVHPAPVLAGLHVPLRDLSGRTDTVVLTGGERRTRLWGAKSGRGDLVSEANEEVIPLCNRLFRGGFSSMQQQGGKEKFQVPQP